MAVRAVITATGSAAPDGILSNADLEKLVETSDAWILQRTGISERRKCSESETSSTISIVAANKAIAKAGIDPDSIETVICGTVTGDMPFPATACLIQDAIGAKHASAFDVGAACAGFIYSLDVAAAMVESGRVRRALVIGVDTLTKYIDFGDRSTCVLFGDGAGAVIVDAEENTDRGLISTVLFSDGSGANFINFEAGGSKYPIRSESFKHASQRLHMAGAETYRFAVNAMGDACCKALEKAGMTTDQVDLFVPHQANIRIIDSAAERLNLPPEKVFKNVDRYGNTSGGSIPLALDEAVEKGILKPGMIVMTVGFGAGLVWGANLIRW